MTRSLRVAVVAIAVCGTPAFAQQVHKDGDHTANSGVAANHQVFKQMSSWIITAAENMPEADYAYKPVPTVRSFGQLVGHVAGANYMFCAMALGEPMKPEYDIEKTMTTKAQLVGAMKASVEYCAKAYAMSDMHASMNIKLFGRDATRMYALSLNAAHDAEHYGNIVTYMRMKGMVPPSSQ